MHQDGLNLSPIRASAPAPAAPAIPQPLTSPPNQGQGQLNRKIQNMERVREQLDHILKMQQPANPVTSNAFASNVRGDSFKGEGQEGLQSR